MTNAQKRRFASYWKKEYEATLKINSLQADLEKAEMLCLPKARLKSRIASWRIKQTQSLQVIESMIKKGEVSENAASECKEVLGNLYGYVADCYHCLYLDCVAA
jgi:hypothetical protein|nr:hypothetical protein [Alteromonas macleodii]|tara:strand:- start:547 stop:858 length:312 start_codon:yes stop_codon:yes gene_type:complete